MNTILQERLAAVRLFKQARAVACLETIEAGRGKLNPVPTRRRAKEARKSFVRNARESQAGSMLNMARPAGHKTLPRFPSERERVLFKAHISRREAGWIRG